MLSYTALGIHCDSVPMRYLFVLIPCTGRMHGGEARRSQSNEVSHETTRLPLHILCESMRPSVPRAQMARAVQGAKSRTAHLVCARFAYEVASRFLLLSSLLLSDFSFSSATCTTPCVTGNMMA